MTTDNSNDCITAANIKEVADYLYSSGLAWKTPLLTECQEILPCPEPNNFHLYLKLESSQNSGCFKSRGIANQFRHLLPKGERKTPRSGNAAPMVTFSAGNYAKTFATVCREAQIDAKVVMPNTAPISRIKAAEDNGAKVQLVPVQEVTQTVDKIVHEEGALFISPFDDLRLVDGYGSIGLEVLEQCPGVDLILVPCGGAGLLTGIAAAVKLAGSSAEVIGVEPETASTVFTSFYAGRRVSLPSNQCSLESLKPFIFRLSPPGERTFPLCLKYTDNVVTVTDQEIAKTVKIMFHAGLVVEPLGSVAVAAVLSGKVAVKGKCVVAVVSGCNVEPHDLQKIMRDVDEK